MPWAKLDDVFHNHPKVLKAGNEAIGMHARALSYCACYLTDGFVPDEFVKRRHRLARRLCVAGLWARVEGGYKIHDYLDFNPSAEKVRAQRELDQVRKDSRRNRPGFQPDSARIPSAPSRPVPTQVLIQKPSAAKRVHWQEDGFVVDPVLERAWGEAYPGINVPLTVKQAHAYFLANPEKKKSNWQRTLVNWLKREQDRNPRPNGAIPPDKVRPAILDLPPLTDDQAAENQRRAKEMVATAMGRLPGMAS